MAEIKEDDFAFVYLDVDYPPIAWLAYRGIINSSDIESANPGNISWFEMDVLKRGLASTLRRENALEIFRTAEFPDHLSRLKCVYAHPSLEAARLGDYGRGKFRGENLVAIAPATEEPRVERYDSTWIDNFSSLPIETARRYWSGEMTETPRPELLLSGRFSIYGTTVRERAYSTLLRTWPDALALLEISRLARHFGSDLGSISPWVVKDGDVIRCSYIIKYSDEDGPSILEQAFQLSQRDETFAINRQDLEPLRNHNLACKLPDLRPYEFEIRPEVIARSAEALEGILRHVNSPPTSVERRGDDLIAHGR